MENGIHHTRMHYNHSLAEYYIMKVNRNWTFIYYVLYIFGNIELSILVTFHWRWVNIRRICGSDDLLKHAVSPDFSLLTYLKNGIGRKLVQKKFRHSTPLNSFTCMFNSLSPGKFFQLFCCLLIFFKIDFFEKLFQEYDQSVKQFGSRAGQTFCYQ